MFTKPVQRFLDLSGYALPDWRACPDGRGLDVPKGTPHGARSDFNLLSIPAFAGMTLDCLTSLLERSGNPDLSGQYFTLPVTF